MEIVAGQIVKSIAGHDKGNYFLVTDVNGKVLTLCDGKYRPLERQKKKKEIHIAQTSAFVDLTVVKTNREIRKAIKNFSEKTHN